ncbi:MAG: hydrogenase maturation peptidase HycI [Alphaproteobacteria bacterium]|nr:hydrogenase maturation peptidase HycI [Alphaproteobacteria bacterium]
MNGQVVLTVGNRMMGDDGAGPLLASLLRRSPAPGWQVVNGASAPENVVHQVRAIAPERVLVVDAAEMELEVGEIRIVDDRFIAERFIVTTHDLPLSFLIATLRETVPDVRLLGIQPRVVAFGYPMSDAVERAVRSIHTALQGGPSLDAWLTLPLP